MNQQEPLLRGMDLQVCKIEFRLPEYEVKRFLYHVCALKQMFPTLAVYELSGEDPGMHVPLTEHEKN